MSAPFSRYFFLLLISHSNWSFQSLFYYLRFLLRDHLAVMCRHFHNFPETPPYTKTWNNPWPQVFLKISTLKKAVKSNVSVWSKQIYIVICFNDHFLNISNSMILAFLLHFFGSFLIICNYHLEKYFFSGETTIVKTIQRCL